MQIGKDLLLHDFEISWSKEIKGESWSIRIFRTDRMLDHVPSWEIK